MLYFESEDGKLYLFTLEINSLIPSVEIRFVQTDRNVSLPSKEILDFFEKDVCQNTYSTGLKVGLTFERSRKVIDDLLMESKLKNEK